MGRGVSVHGLSFLIIFWGDVPARLVLDRYRRVNTGTFTRVPQLAGAPQCERQRMWGRRAWVVAAIERHRPAGLNCVLKRGNVSNPPSIAVTEITWSKPSIDRLVTTSPRKMSTKMDLTAWKTGSVSNRSPWKMRHGLDPNAFVVALNATIGLPRIRKREKKPPGKRRRKQSKAWVW